MILLTWLTRYLTDKPSSESLEIVIVCVLLFSRYVITTASIGQMHISDRTGTVPGLVPDRSGPAGFGHPGTYPGYVGFGYVGYVGHFKKPRKKPGKKPGPKQSNFDVIFLAMARYIVSYRISRY